VTTLAWIVVVLLAVGVVLVASAWAATARRLGCAEASIRALERHLGTVEASSAQALDAARDAAARARRASGDEEPAPRVVLEPVTGPLVKAVAFGVGARRAVARLTRSTGGPR
jgi:hypothetical protein